MQKLLIATLMLGATVAHAAPAAPTAVLAPPDAFVEYTGVGPIGNNNLNTNDSMYWIYESSGTYMGQAIDSWFIFFDPRRDVVAGTISFSGDILFVQDERAELIATAGFGKTGVTYDYSSSFVGLEAANRSATSYTGNQMVFAWTATDPGDHIRIMTAAVPEPQSYALMLAGLAAIAAGGARRRRAD